MFHSNFLSKYSYSSPISTENMKTLTANTEFGTLTVTSNKLTDSLINEFNKKFNGVKTKDEFNFLVEELNQELMGDNLFKNFEKEFSGFDKLFSSLQDNLSTHLKRFSNGLSPFTITEEDIDQKIEYLNQMKTKIREDKQKEILLEKKKKLQSDIQILENKLTIKSKELINVLHDKLQCEQIQNEMIVIKNEIGKLQEEVKQLHI